ncbi:uncharacterized protein F5147DRAFT_777906 [Suillus discolor]|uniref:Uncharacterized protein n=1 Tax=Suillus discolor TaxID=1912936 RepID=A0A9P7JQE5_9AGAM|nr:uncharacterized protein F5147DRAFT_777906 [Suillus discolor]KAG2097744.1 hypothetical protein F5147DRAFT_777906 [Suillus discolor]
MPERYVPFYPSPLAPLTLDPMSSPTAFLNLDSNLESFDDALKSMQSQNTTTGLVCSPPRFHYQFDNFIRLSSLSTTSVITARTMLVGTPSTTSVGTPQTTLVVTPRTTSVITPRTTSVGTPQTMSVITPHTMLVFHHTRYHTSPAAPTTTIPITTSSVAAPTTPVTLGTRPSQLISGVGLDAQNPSNVVDERPAKHQKRAQCTCAGETDPPQAVSSGQGKRQRSSPLKLLPPM